MTYTRSGAPGGDPAYEPPSGGSGIGLVGVGRNACCPNPHPFRPDPTI